MRKITRIFKPNSGARYLRHSTTHFMRTASGKQVVRKTSGGYRNKRGRIIRGR